MASNKKRVYVSSFLHAGGWDVLHGRDDVETIKFPGAAATADLNALLQADDPVHAIIVGLTRIGEGEVVAAKDLQVVARMGVGFDTIDIPALSRHRVPLMTVGQANAVSVAEQAMFFMMNLAKRGALLHAMVRDARWSDRLSDVPIDLAGKTLLVIGFGRIGTRICRRALAMEMSVLVYDPYVPAERIRAAGCEPAADLDAAVPRADVITIHCPKSPETVGLFGAARIARMKKTAYLINTARGGLVDEAALHAALTAGGLAGAALDVFDKEPPDPANPLLTLPNVITAPHMAGVTRESMERMAVQCAHNVLSVFDGRPLKENAINPDVFG